MRARYDLKKYEDAVQCMENFYPALHGDAVMRPGTVYVADLGERCVILPFSFNVEPSNNFVLVFSDRKLRIATATSLTGPTLASPYTDDELYDISHAQVGDIVYLAHENHPLHKVERTGSLSTGYSWSLKAVTLNVSIRAPGAPTVTFDRNNPDDDANLGYTLRYKITAVDDKGHDSLAGPAGEANGKHPGDWVEGNRVWLSWDAVPGAREYNIYREEAGYYGFIGVSRGTSFMDNNYQADTSDTPREDWDPFKNNNNPAIVTFHQQRMVLAGTRTEPHAFYMSRVGDFENFRKSRPLQEDDPVEYLIASGSIDQITWAASFGDLLIGTAGAEYKGTGPDGTITAKHVQITSQSFWGSAPLPPLIIGNSVLHCQRHGARVRDLAYSLEKDGYTGNDLSILAPHLSEGQRLLQWCYQQTPNSNVWIVREDGVLLCLTYLKEHQIYGWSRHLTDGKVRSVCALSGDNTDILMLVVERKGKFYLERLAREWTDDRPIEDAHFVDCGWTVRNTTASKTVSGLWHLEGREVAVLADGSPVEGCKVSAGAVTLPYPAKVVHVGLPYRARLGLLPIETNAQQGSTFGKRRAYGTCVMRFHRTVGGRYGATPDEMYDIPYLPQVWGDAVPPFSGNVELVMPSAQDPDTAIWLDQPRPLPMRVVAVAAEIDFGEV